MTERFANLKWKRLSDPYEIPIYLVDQIKEKEFDTKRFYDYQSITCIEKQGNKEVLNPFNLLYKIYEENGTIVGFLWCVVDILNGHLLINNFSMDRKYWCKGKAVGFLRNQINNILINSKLKKVYWCTKHTKYMEKYGFKKSPSILMEYQLEKDDGFNINGDAVKVGGIGESDDARTVPIFKPTFGTEYGECAGSVG